MKIVINKCFGGFGLSPAGIKRMAELQGRACHFFERPAFKGAFSPVDIDAFQGGRMAMMMLSAFDIPNPNELVAEGKENELYRTHRIDECREDRANLLLVRTVEELGDTANGACAKLAIVEIPDGVEWEIEEYDGSEHVAEAHRTWS